MEYLSAFWNILTGHPIYSKTFFFGFILYIIGGRLSYIVERQKFDGRNQSGLQQFDSYKDSVNAQWKWGFMNLVGKVGLWIWMFSFIALLFNHFA